MEYIDKSSCYGVSKTGKIKSYLATMRRRQKTHQADPESVMVISPEFDQAATMVSSTDPDYDPVSSGHVDEEDNRDGVFPSSFHRGGPQKARSLCPKSYNTRRRMTTGAFCGLFLLSFALVTLVLGGRRGHFSSARLPLVDFGYEGYSVAPDADTLLAASDGFEAMKDRGRHLTVSTWNIAAINNNPFEYWITYPDDPEYEKLMVRWLDVLRDCPLCWGKRGRPRDGAAACRCRLGAYQSRQFSRPLNCQNPATFDGSQSEA